MGDQPWFVVVGGINGAGKTTTSEMLADGLDPGRLTFLNPDLETAKVLAADPTLTQTAANFRGLRTVREAIGALMAARQDLVVETVFANQAYLRLMERAKQSGMASACCSSACNPLSSPSSVSPGASLRAVTMYLRRTFGIAGPSCMRT